MGKKKKKNPEKDRPNPSCKFGSLSQGAQDFRLKGQKFWGVIVPVEEEKGRKGSEKG